MAKREFRLLIGEGKEWMVVFQYPNDYAVTEWSAALHDKVAVPLAVKHTSGPMDQRYWMSLDLVKLDMHSQNRFNNYKVVKVSMLDDTMLQVVGDYRKEAVSLPQVKVGGVPYEVFEKNGQYFVAVTKVCQSCGVSIIGTCKVYEKDGKYVNIQGFIPDPEFKGSMPVKTKSKLWLCHGCNIRTVTDDVKGQYVPSIPVKKVVKAHPILTAKEIKELKDEIRHLRKEMRSLWSVEEMERFLFVNMNKICYGKLDMAAVGAICMFLNDLKK